jgi:uncharacterized protein (DUF169 family)
MAGRDWKALSKEIRERVALPTAPVGVKLLKNHRELLDHREAKLLTNTAPCHLAAMARYNHAQGIVGASDIGTKCTWGAACLGLIATPERLRNGELNRTFVRDDPAGKRLSEGMAMLGNQGKRYSGVIMAPLDHMPFEPDAVVIYMSPARALRLIYGFTYAAGEPILNNVTGQASLCSGIARAVDKGQVSLDVPCMGDRMYGLVQEFEMVMTFPAARMDELIEGLRRTEGVAAYPFSPFLQWSAIFPPQFEPRSGDFEQEK